LLFKLIGVMSKIRDVHIALQIWREWLLGRTYKTHLRVAQDMSPRPGPQPVLPESSFTTISDNHYFKRDGRREVGPPQVLVSAMKQITAKDIRKDENKTVPVGSVTPGKAFNWTEVA
jgi:hypothetical protein